ncbi:thermonuclease family protein [Rhizobium wenxiniae]|uniref:thermonuclease family protein n=1 Tax=Rhizobium wenxiniae TaxID=1737357 RepID=UPI001C6ED879|nr:thermonuclease family protein [Rhizobium wenxiniae]
MTRLAKTLKDGLFLGAFLVLASLIVAKIDLNGDTRISGPFYAIDGDTLAAGAERLRLIGIDAPESDQSCGGEGGNAWTCGDAARDALSKFAASPDAYCAGSSRDRYGRVLVRCKLGETDVNAELVRQGMAVASGDYHEEETAARGEGRGIWSAPFETPRAWRAAKGAAAEDDGSAGDESLVDTILDRLKGWLPWS